MPHVNRNLGTVGGGNGLGGDASNSTFAKMVLVYPS